MRRVVGGVRGRRRHQPPSRACGRARSERDQAQHPIAILGIDHAGEEAPRRLASAGPELLEDAADARGLQAGKLHRQRLARRGRIEEPLAAIIVALFLHDIAVIDQLLEHAAEGLLGDFENVEQVGNLHAGIAVDEMQDAVMRAAEPELDQDLVRVADEIAVGEEQELDQVPVRLRLRRCCRPGRRAGCAGLLDVVIPMSAIMSALLTYFPLLDNPKSAMSHGDIVLGLSRHGVARASKGRSCGAATTIPGVRLRRKSPRTGPSAEKFRRGAGLFHSGRPVSWQHPSTNAPI